MKLKDRLSGLILDNESGVVVGSKLAAATGHLLMSLFFAYHNYKTGFNADKWMIYGSIVAGHKTAEKLINLKWGNTNASNNSK